MRDKESSTIAFGELVRETHYYAEGCRAALAAAGLSWTPGPGNRRLYDREAALDAVDRYRGGAGRLCVAEARAKRMHCEAELAWLKVERLAAQLVPANEVAEAWRSHVEQVRERFLPLGSEVAPKLASAKDLHTIENVLREAIYEKLAELADSEG